MMKPIRKPDVTYCLSGDARQGYAVIKRSYVIYRNEDGLQPQLESIVLASQLSRAEAEALLIKQLDAKALAQYPAPLQAVAEALAKP